MLEMTGERDCQVFEVFWGDTVFLNSFWFFEFLLWYHDFVQSFLPEAWWPLQT